MAISNDVKKNFETLRDAFASNAVCVVETVYKGTTTPCFMLCAVNYLSDGSIDLVPFGELVNENPYEKYENPFVAMEAADNA